MTWKVAGAATRPSSQRSVGAKMKPSPTGVGRKRDFGDIIYFTVFCGSCEGVSVVRAKVLVTFLELFLPFRAIVARDARLRGWVSVDTYCPDARGTRRKSIGYRVGRVPYRGQKKIVGGCPPGAMVGSRRY